jgi:ATP-dependent Lon protease
MNKKVAKKRKKLISQIRHHRVTADGRVLTADGRETLLGNLAPVKHIPMLPWKRVIVFPTAEKTITVATGGENAWIYKLLEETSKKTHDLIGFTPVRELSAEGFEDIAVGSIGMAAQVLKVEPSDDGAKANVYLKGICRYENIGFLRTEEDHFCINIRWFEDIREADSLVKPQYEQCMKILEEIGNEVKRRNLQDKIRIPKSVRYDYTVAQYLSFIFIDGFMGWFNDEEKWELLRLRSTSARLKRISERAKEYIPALESE